MNLDVFSGDAFKMIPLSQAITLIPHVPTQIRSMGLFAESGITTTDVMIEMVNEVLTLVPTAPRGAPGAVKNLQRRNVRKLSAVHLPQRVALLADEVLGLRAFGKQTEEELAMSRLTAKMKIARRDLDLTIEWQRMGAIKGIVLDSDASTVLLNLFTEFAVSQQTLDMALDVDATKVRSKCVTVQRMIEDKLGGLMNTGVDVLCSAEFFDDLVDHKAVSEAWKYATSNANALTGDVRRGFQFGNLNFVEYRGKVGATRFIEVGCAYAVPTGVPDLFNTYYAPANYMEAIGTEGLPYYASQEPMDHGKGIDVETQSNPLHICNRPNAIIKLGRNAAALA